MSNTPHPKISSDSAIARSLESTAELHRRRPLSYVSSARTRAGRVIVRALEDATGRKRLLPQLIDYRAEMAAGKSYWRALWDRMDLRLELPGGGLDSIPADGPLIVVANHPWGILDGLTLGRILDERRPDFKFIANDWLAPDPSIANQILPIDRSATREGLMVNLETRRAAIRHLREGGCVAVFPAGQTASPRRVFARAFDANWKQFTATLILASKAQVTPILLEGQNSRLFYIADHLNPTIRLGLLIREFKRRMGDSVRAWIGDPAPQELIDAHKRDPKRLMAVLRSHTYALSPELIDRLTTGKPYGGDG